MKPKMVVIVSSLLLWTSTALTAQRVQTSYDHKADFSSYKTYSWFSKTASTSLWDQRVENAVNSSLAAKGLRQVPSGGDLAIFASDTSQERQKLVAVCNGTREGWGGGGFGGGPFCDATTTTKSYKVDSLAVKIFDGNSNAVLWCASSTNTLPNDPDIIIKSPDTNVERLFSHFPLTHINGDLQNMPFPATAAILVAERKSLFSNMEDFPSTIDKGLE